MDHGIPILSQSIGLEVDFILNGAEPKGFKIVPSWTVLAMMLYMDQGRPCLSQSISLVADYLQIGAGTGRTQHGSLQDCAHYSLGSV